MHDLLYLHLCNCLGACLSVFLFLLRSMFIVFLLSRSGTRFWGLFGRPLFGGGLSPLLTHFIALGQINKLLAAFCLISFERAPNIYHSLNKFCSAAVCSVRQCSLKRCARVLFRQQFSLLTLLVMLMRGPTDGRTDGRTGGPDERLDLELGLGLV